MSPRKSSTSSGKPLPRRPRYLGVEVAGEPFPSPRLLEKALRDSSGAPGSLPLRFRIIRLAGVRAIVEVSQWDLARARRSWNGEGSGHRLLTRRTWGTLRKAKAWCRSHGEPRGGGASASP